MNKSFHLNITFFFNFLFFYDQCDFLFFGSFFFLHQVCVCVCVCVAN